MTDTRCERTGNQVGTDTWAVGYSCPCAPCQALMAAAATPVSASPAKEDDEDFARVLDDIATTGGKNVVLRRLASSAPSVDKPAGWREALTNLLELADDDNPNYPGKHGVDKVLRDAYAALSASKGGVGDGRS